LSVELLAGPFAALLLGYALGAIPFGMILTRLAGAGDLRAIGSGSIGATNVLRTGRKDLAIVTLLLDMAKGIAAIVLANWWFDQPAIAALGAFFGHLYPVWLRFAGGKGLATLFGLLVGFALIGSVGVWAPAAYAIVWLAVLAATRISSVAGLAAAVTAPIACFLLGHLDLALLFLGFALITFWRHRGNIGRLRAGTEPRIGRGRG
jgi:glycerol-3-phosphate acyltransferase PlsY